MEPQEFFTKVKAILDSTKGSDPIGVDYFIQDTEDLIEQWREEDDHERKLF